MVIASARARRRGEARKLRLHAFFNDVAALIREARKSAVTKTTKRNTLNLRNQADSTDSAAMRASAEGMPGRTLRRLAQRGTLQPT